MGKIVRISKPETFVRYKDKLEEVLLKHIEKAQSDDTVSEILEEFHSGFNNPARFNCIIEGDNGDILGFALSAVLIDKKGAHIYMDQFACPNSIAASAYRSITKKFREETGITRVYFFTHRNPEAWLELLKKRDLMDFKLHGYILVEEVV